MPKAMVLLNMLMQNEIVIRYDRTEEERFVSFDDDVKRINFQSLHENQPEYLYQPKTYCSKRRQG